MISKIFKTTGAFSRIVRHHACGPTIFGSMEMKSLVRLALAGLVALQLPLLNARSVSAQSGTQPSAFECRSEDGVNYTIAMRSNGEESEPIIVWTSNEFSGSGYPPARRCELVSDRLNTLLKDNGYSLSGLYLTGGRVNGQSVICTVGSDESGCNQYNVLFTLSGTNASDPNRALENLSSRVTSGNVIQESGGQVYVDLEGLVLGHF
jgi:Circadian oscillating protein COP23